MEEAFSEEPNGPWSESRHCGGIKGQTYKVHGIKTEKKDTLSKARSCGRAHNTLEDREGLQGTTTWGKALPRHKETGKARISQVGTAAKDRSPACLKVSLPPGNYSRGTVATDETRLKLAGGYTESSVHHSVHF